MPHDPARLHVLTRARQLAVDCHVSCDRHHVALRQRAPAVRTQLLRGVDLVPHHIALGASAPHAAGFLAALDVAIAACADVEVQLDLALAVGALPSSCGKLRAEATMVRRMARGLRKYVAARAAAGTLDFLES